MLDFKGKEGCYGLTESLESAGCTVMWVDNAPVCRDEGAAQAVIDAYDTLAYARGVKWLEIQALRDSRKFEGVNVGAYRFHTDADSRTQYLGLKDQGRDVLAAGGAMTDVLTKFGQPVTWKTMGGVWVPMTIQLAFDVVAAVGDLDALVFVAAVTYAGQTAGMTDYDALLALDVSAGWPA